MEEVLGFFGFSLGATIGAGVVRPIFGGTRPALREVLKTGIRAWDVLAGASASARASVGSMADEARVERRPSPARSGRRGAPRKIAIARE